MHTEFKHCHSMILLVCVLLILPGGVMARGQQPAQEQPVAAQGDGQANKVIREGIAIEFQMQALNSENPASHEAVPGVFQEGDQVTIRFNITDTTSGMPLSGVYPAAWMDLKPRSEMRVPGACQQKVEAFVGGSLLAPPELDLNVYYVLAMNNDATISVVDPLFGFGTTKLLDMVFLDTPGLDWALTPDQQTLFVSMPESDQVAVVETSSWDVVANINVSTRPASVALQPDARYLWVGRSSGAQSSGVSVIDVRELAVVEDIATGEGHHEIAFSDDNRYAYVTNEKAGTLSVIDIRRLVKVKDIHIGKRPVAVAFSPIGQAAYVVDTDSGSIVVVGGDDHRVLARIQAEPGLGQLKFAPGTRLGFVVNTEHDMVHILDTALNRIIQTADVEDGPDQIAFSDELAYVRHRDSEIVLMIPLDMVGTEGKPVPVIDFTGGQAPLGRVSTPSLADSIVQAPGATAVLVANAADKVIYFYKEGMAAPMGQFQNYGREPRAIQVVDSSLKERAPGVYETTARLRRPGLYDVAFFLDSPRTIHCFEVTVAPSPERQAERARNPGLGVEPLFKRRELRVGERISLTFKLTNPLTGEPRIGLKDVSVLTFKAPGGWQKRQWAVQGEDGVYAVEFVPPQTGAYYVFVEARSLGVRYNNTPYTVLRVKEASADDKTGEPATLQEVSPVRLSLQANLDGGISE